MLPHQILAFGTHGLYKKVIQKTCKLISQLGH